MVARLRHLRHRELDGLARDRLDHTKNALSLGIPAGRKPEYPVNINTGNNLMTIGVDGVDIAADFPRVVFSGDVPVGLESGRLYWIENTSLNFYAVHTSKEDAVADVNRVVFTDGPDDTLMMTILD